MEQLSELYQEKRQRENQSFEADRRKIYQNYERKKVDKGSDLDI